MHQQPPQPPQQPPASKLPLSPITTEQIQKYLEENKNLILAILEYQKVGKYQECAQCQSVLQKNLMYLAAIADGQPSTPQTPNPSHASSSFSQPPHFLPQASNFIQQPHQQPGVGGGSGGGGQRPQFQVNPIHTQDQQQQLLHFQQLQQVQAQMGFRSGAQNGMYGMQSALVANPGGRQGGSEAAYGGDGRGMFFDNGGFGDS